MNAWQKQKKRLISGLLVIFMLVIATGSSYVPNMKAASKDTVDLRFIFTTDVHGQLNNIDYESGKEYNIGSLSKAYTLIKQARNEKKSNNSFTFDIGDVLYDYSTEYIFSEDQKAVQPIYLGMEKIGYDAMVLGNHDFDYGYDYIMNQLSGANLMDKIIVSNIMDVQTDEHIFNENMIIEREAVSANGKKVKVKVGIIGEAIPVLSTKTENYTDRLKTEDIVENTKAQAAKLKSEGADVIVVLAHSGFGETQTQPMDGNVSYALTTIPEVDVVLCGHQHSQFPSDNKNTVIYQMPGVDKNTNLVNGKNLVMSLDRGKSIGLADITLQIDGNAKRIVNRKSEVRKVQASTTSDRNIANLYGTWEDKLYEYSRKSIGNIRQEDEITNYFGLVEDNAALQLVNNAKRSFAHKYIYTKATQYKGYPVIAASYYNRFGQNSYTDFVNISGSITESDLSSIQIYNNYIALYEINGKQLREWLEWMASAFETVGNKKGWSDGTMQQYITANNISSLVSEDWLHAWDAYRIFDGVEYTIDPAIKPRYDKSGNKIGNTYRITKLTCNGVEIQDSAKFVLATDRITKTVEAMKGLDKQYIVKGYNRTQALLAEYVEQLGKLGDIKPTADYNWRLSLKDDYPFIVKASKASDTLAKKQKWYVSDLGTSGEYNYYIGKFGNTYVDKIGPGIVLTPIEKETTSQTIPIIVDAKDSSGIEILKYALGDYEADSPLWSVASDVQNNTITAYSNGIYTVLAVDKNGNKSVEKLMIDNLQHGALQAPVVNTYTNRKSKITGKALANTSIFFETDKKTYESKVDNMGNFSYALPSQPSSSELYVYIKDENGGQSPKRTVKVKRTGPNRPSVSAVNNNDGTLGGKTNDNAASILISVADSKKVYIAKDKVANYEASEIYNEDFTIVQVPVNVTSSGKYLVTMPSLPAGVKLTVYGIDHLNRVSRSISTTVKEEAPNSPQLYSITNAEMEVSGFVPNAKKDVEYEITVIAGGEEFTGTAENGKFTIPIKPLTLGEKVEAYAVDNVGGAQRKSYTSSVMVESMDDYVTNKSGIYLNPITNKEFEISGNYEAFQSLYISTGKFVESIETDEGGDFKLSLDNQLAAGTKIYAYTKFSNGGVVAAQGITVKAAVPDRPSVDSENITNNTKDIKVISEEKCTAQMSVGKDKYSTSKYTYDKENKLYYYSFTIPRTNSGTSIKITAKNSVGTSKALNITVTKAAPDSPYVEKVDTESEKITGEVELVPRGEEDITVAATKTKIYAKAGNKEYKGTIKEDGSFTIKIPKQKKGSVIAVWGENHSGKGPQSKITVKNADSGKKK